MLFYRSVYFSNGRAEGGRADAGWRRDTTLSLVSAGKDTNTLVPFVPSGIVPISLCLGLDTGAGAAS